MKNVTNLSFLFIILSIGLVSCDPASQYKTEIAQIDSCLAELDTLENLYDGIEFDSLNMMVKHVEENEALIKELYEPDTLNATFGRQMTDSKAIRKTLKDVDKDKMIYGDELNAVKHQFMDLREDVLNGALNDDQIEEYLNVEKAALSKVKLAFLSFYNVQNQEKYRYYMVVPQVDLFIEGLKAKRDTIE